MLRPCSSEIDDGLSLARQYGGHAYKCTVYIDYIMQQLSTHEYNRILFNGPFFQSYYGLAKKNNGDNNSTFSQTTPLPLTAQPTLRLKGPIDTTQYIKCCYWHTMRHTNKTRSATNLVTLKVHECIADSRLCLSYHMVICFTTRY